MPAFVQSSSPCCCEPMKWYLHSGPMTLVHSGRAIGNSLVLNLPQGQQLNWQNSRTDDSHNAQDASIIIIMSRVCNHSADQSDRRTNAARFCDLTCHLTFGPELAPPAPSQLVQTMRYCNFTNFRCVKISVLSDHGAFGGVLISVSADVVVITQCICLI